MQSSVSTETIGNRRKIRLIEEVALWARFEISLIAPMSKPRTDDPAPAPGKYDCGGQCICWGGATNACGKKICIAGPLAGGPDFFQEGPGPLVPPLAPALRWSTRTRSISRHDRIKLERTLYYVQNICSWRIATVNSKHSLKRLRYERRVLRTKERALKQTLIALIIITVHSSRTTRFFK